MSATRSLSRHEIWYGRDEPPDEKRQLHAGPVDVLLVGPDIRYLRLGQSELVRRVYMAVRDPNWDTVAGELSDFAVEDEADRFRVTFAMRHTLGPIEFSWHGAIEGTADGTISYAMDGRCESAFAYAKIGLCLHHPLAESLGRAFRVDTPDGEVRGRLPDQIEPQIHLGAEQWDLPLFDPCSALAIESPHGGELAFAFEGELFEMEDQRNWSDGSFKTCSTPAYLGYTHESVPGQVVRQRVTITPPPSAPRSTRTAARRRGLAVGPPGEATLPPIGLGQASDGRPLTPAEARVVRLAAPAHVRADVRFGDAADEDLEAALATCRALDCGLELALFLQGDPGPPLRRIARTLAANGVEVPRILVFRPDEEATNGHWVRLVRGLMADRVPASYVGGTNTYFNELNRNRPDMTAMDAVAWSINPQIHAFDERSLVEALEGQTATVRSGRAFAEGKPVVVSPITLRPRFNAVAVAPDTAGDGGALPWPVDPRQMSLFCAAWTIASIAGLAGAGAASLTYYETAGWRGLVEREGELPQPERFPSNPGIAFPVLQVFADLAGWRGAQIRAVEGVEPLALHALALELGGRRRVLVANLSEADLAVPLAGLAGDAALVRRLDESSAPLALADPEAFRASGRRQAFVAGELALELPPFATVCIDQLD